MSSRSWDAGLSPLKRAYLAVEQLQAKIETLERGAGEPIAIIGIGCRFPGGADTPDDLWRLVHRGIDAIGDVPAERWSTEDVNAAGGGTAPTRGGFLVEVDRFDPALFGISPREAFSLDPQHRLLLEVAWEALERAGQIRNRLAANQTGVFIGITSHDYAQLHGASGSSDELDAYHITGNALNAAAGRLSYVFGFQGPCLAVDTACSSSLVAVHLACRSLASGECSLALAGGVNLILSPFASIALSRAHVLSEDGRCKAFDAAADGMGRGEGCGVVVLKRLSDAMTDRDHIIAVIAGSAVNQDGPSSGLTVPNGPAQEALIRRALAAARLSSEHVDYIEAHGTGTALGDPVEFGALAAVFGARSPDRPLYLGSVKSNLGHAEAAAGIAGLIKAALSVHHSEIPPHLHFTRPSPHIRWSGTPITIATRPTRWPETTNKRTAGVSSFGFTGTNAHVVVQEAPPLPARQSVAPSRPLHLLVLSARSVAALKTLAARYSDHLQSADASCFTEDVCFTASTGRGHFEHRLAIEGDSPESLVAPLKAFATGVASRVTVGHSESKPRIAWVFPDDCGQPVVGASVETEPTFRESLEACNRILQPHLDGTLVEMLPGRARHYDSTHRRLTLFALQYAFGQLWRSWGITPVALMGNGVGNYAAAVVADILSLDDALNRLLARAHPPASRETRDYDTLMEIGPASPQSRIAGSDVPGITPDETECRQLLRTLGELYVRGADVDWQAFWRHRAGRHVVLPTYPFDRQRYWIRGATERARPRAALAPTSAAHPLLGERMPLAGTSEQRFQSRVRATAPAFLRDHRVLGDTVLPAAAYLELAFAAAGRAEPSPAIELREVTFQRALVLSAETDTRIQTVLTGEGKSERRFAVFSNPATDDADDAGPWLEHCSGVLAFCAEEPQPSGPDLQSLQRAIADPVLPQDVYQRCSTRGIELGPQFRALTGLMRRDGEALGVVELPTQTDARAGRFHFHPVLLDGCLQVLNGAGWESGTDNVYLPLTLGRVRVSAPVPARLWSHARIRPTDAADPSQLIVDLSVFADDGRMVATIDELQLQRTRATNLRQGQVRHDWLYEIEWHPQTQPQELQAAERVATARAIWAEALSTTAISPPADEDVAYQRVLGELEELATQHIVQALRTLGASFTPGGRFTTQGLAADLRIVERHHKQLHRFLEMFGEDGWLERSGDTWHVTGAPTVFDPEERARRLERQFPAAQHEVQLLHRCGSRLPDVLRGECDPLELLFPDGPAVSAASLYQDSPGALAANAVIERVFAAYVARLPAARRLRVLEIGGGTGGTTASLLPHLAGRDVEYVFTDVSAAFVARARQRFSACPSIDYRTFDVERAPSGQGFASGTFDLVLAANVLHATRDLKESLGHAHELLAPGGMLLLLEGVTALRFIDLIFGMTDGWWRFSDVSVRPNHPLISVPRWTALLQEGGFDASAEVSPRGQAGLFANQAVIVSTRGHAGEQVAEPWVLLADSQGVGDQVADRLALRGAPCALVTPSDTYDARAGCRYSVDPHNPDHYGRVLDDFARTTGAPVRGIVHLWALDATAEHDPAALRAATTQQCESALHLLQAVARRRSERPPKLMLVTRGAQAAGGHQPLAGVFQAPLWGLAKALALEHPELNCVRLDLDPAERDNASLAGAVIDELYATGAEGEIAFRGEQRLVSRLARHATPRAEAPPLRFRDDATYLITGGLTGLGMRVAQWMGSRGARQLALMARSAPSAVSREQIAALRDQGVVATHYQGDVSDVDDVRRVLEEIEASSPPLRGIIHSAGVLADGSLLHQTWDRFERVLPPKVDGAWHLHALTRELPLDCFVLFSSAAAMLGSPAQANHCAANAFLDALAAYRRAQGLPAISINWGAWSEIGSAAGSAVRARLATNGMGAMTPEEGLKLLEYVMTGSAPQVGAIPMEWSFFMSRFAKGAEPRFFSLIASAERARGRPDASSAGQVQPFPVHASVAERSAWLQHYLIERVAAALQLASVQVSPTKPLNLMGLDSLMAIEIRNRLKTDLALDVPIVTFLDGSTIAALASTLAQTTKPVPGADGPSVTVENPATWDPSQQGALPQEISPAVATQLLSRVNELTADQIDALLAVVAATPPGIGRDPS